MIEVHNLTKIFGEVTALQDVSFSVGDGQIFGFLGPNGSGKTTTVRILICLLCPTSGHAFVGSCDISKEPSAVRKIIGYLPETFGLYDELTAYELLDYSGALHQIEKEKRKAAIQDLLKRFDLWDRRMSRVGTFSKGMKQKLAIARALLHEPKVLFLDEPTSGLDPEAATEVRELILGLKRGGRTVFLCTHILYEAERICDTIGILKQGKLIARGSIDELRASLAPARNVVIRADGVGSEILNMLIQTSGVKTARISDSQIIVETDAPDEVVPRINAMLIQAGVKILEIRIEGESLEGIYLKLMAEQNERPVGDSEKGA